MIALQKYKLASMVLAFGVIAAVPQAQAQGLPKLSSLLGGGSPAAVAGDPDAFLKSAMTAEKLMNNSIALLLRGLSSKEKSAELDASRQAAAAVTNPGEREAKLAEIRKSEMAALNEVMSNDKFKEDIKKVDGKKKEELTAATFNFALALLQDKALVDQSSSLISSLSSNPMNLTKVGGIKTAVTSLSNQVSAASKVAGKIPDIFSSVGVKAPASKDEKPKVTAEVAGD